MTKAWEEEEEKVAVDLHPAHHHTIGRSCSQIAIDEAEVAMMTTLMLSGCVVSESMTSTSMVTAPTRRLAKGEGVYDDEERRR